MTLTVRVLGAQSPYPTAGSPCSGYLVEASGTRVLVDLGLAVWPELLRQADPNALAAIWISHLHPDHAGDLLAAYQWAANSDDTQRLRIYGPPGWAERVGAFLPVTDGPEQVRRLFDVREHTQDTEHLDNLTLTAVPVQHSVPTFGLRLTHASVTFAFSADSGPCSVLDALAEEAHLFLCEAGAAEPDGQYHCTPEQAAQAVQDIRRLVLTHLAQGLTPSDASRRAGGAAIAVPGMLLNITR
jgi:ribonuclease BN (tRNA processing enzyme)